MCTVGHVDFIPRYEGLYNMTLVQYFVRFFRPYVELPEFENCVKKAIEELKPKPKCCELDSTCDT